MHQHITATSVLCQRLHLRFHIFMRHFCFLNEQRGKTNSSEGASCCHPTQVRPVSASEGPWLLRICCDVSEAGLCLVSFWLHCLFRYSICHLPVSLEGRCVKLGINQHKPWPCPPQCHAFPLPAYCVASFLVLLQGHWTVPMGTKTHTNPWAHWFHSLVLLLSYTSVLVSSFLLPEPGHQIKSPLWLREGRAVAAGSEALAALSWGKMQPATAVARRKLLSLFAAPFPGVRALSTPALCRGGWEPKRTADLHAYPGLSLFAANRKKRIATMVVPQPRTVKTDPAEMPLTECHGATKVRQRLMSWSHGCCCNSRVSCKDSERLSVSFLRVVFSQVAFSVEPVSAINSYKGDCIVFVSRGTLPAEAVEIDARRGGLLTGAIEEADFKGDAGSVTLYPSNIF